MTNKREFTESWLQALTLSASHVQARSIRPWLSTIQLVGASESLPEQQAEATKLWDYAHANGLVPLLNFLPVRSSPWRFEDNELFVFLPNSERAAADGGDRQAWIADLGFNGFTVPAKAQVTSQDWVTLIREEAIRRRKPLNTGAAPSGNVIEVPCVMRWEPLTWTVQFEQPSWMTLELDGPFQTPRPNIDRVSECLIDVLGQANKRFRSGHKLPEFQSDTTSWIASIGDMADWHREVLIGNSFELSPWLRRGWNCVWPVIYRERNRLKGPCDIEYLRGELKACFDANPEMVEWLFVMARLLCELRLGRGLGICGDFE